ASTLTDYHVTLRMASHLGMMENTDRGIEVRDYFFDAERRLREIELTTKLPQTYKEALQELLIQVEENERLQLEAKEAAPKVEFHDDLVDSKGLYSMSKAAKMLGTGRTRFFEKLRKEEVFFGREPYQSFIERGYFEMKTTTKNGHVQEQPFVTPKGLSWIKKKFYSHAFQTSF
ncbi:phage antirepressor KilAC domain-containing protein, partial [Candidatus Pacearchaeota archaeon]|nr:phage antirepressor KilAC domain-containing protein [Candidatus Pacearchaeota archaeon]